MKFYIFAGLILFVVVTIPVWWLCLRAIPLRISQETTYITEPLTSDGKRVDYFRALENLRYPPEINTDDNGYRLLVRSVGLPENNHVQSDNLRTQFYEKLGLDPDTEPTLKLQSPYTVLEGWENHKLYDEACKRGYWTRDEFPVLTDWLAENSAGIDLLGEAVRKPIFCFPLVRENETSPMTDALSIGTLQQFRELARAACGRAYYRIGTGDIDGAIEDILTVYRLGRYFNKQGMLINYLVGIVIEGMARNVVITGNPDYPPTKEQLKYFIQELNRLPAQVTWQEIYEAERLFCLGTLQEFLDDPTTFTDESFGLYDESNFMKWTVKVFDANLMFTILNQAYARAVTMDTVKIADWETAYRRSRNPLHYLTVQSRTEQIARAFVRINLEVSTSALNSYQRFACLDRLQRATLALLLYEAEHGTLPTGDWREAVKPYLGEMPEQYFSCSSESTGYALVLTDAKTPETPLLVEVKLENISAEGTIANDPALFAKAHVSYVSSLIFVGESAYRHISFRNGVVRSEVVRDEDSESP